MLAALCLMLGLLAPASDPSSSTVDDVVQALSAAQQFEVLSIVQQSGDGDGASFHGYRILGKATNPTADVRRAVNDELKMDVVVRNAFPRCFDPHHGIHAVMDGRTYDLVLCYHCGGVEIFMPDGKGLSGSLGSKSRGQMDAILAAAGIAKPAEGSQH